MNPASTPFYLDWTFWAATIAVLALILLQLPPVRVLFRRTAVSLRPYDRLNVTHWLGNPNVNLHIQLMNTGGRTVKVSALALELTRDDGVIVTLPAQTFSRADGTAGSLLFTRLTLELDKEWANFVTFFSQFTVPDERLSKRLTRDLRLDIDAKLLAQTQASGQKQLVEAAAAQVDPLITFFQNHNFWRPGEYAARLMAICEPSRASVAKSFRFTLFESDVQDLDERTSRYKYGFGVYLTDTAQTEVYPRIKDVA
jgi:hypothetical protein